LEIKVFGESEEDWEKEGVDEEKDGEY